MKRILLLVFTLLLSLVSLQMVSAENYNTPNIYVNNKHFVFRGNKPILRNGRILVPLESEIFEKIGVEVQYDLINKEATIKNKDHLISNFIQELDWYDKGIRCYAADVRSDYLNSDVYVPLRVIVESLGKEITYNQEAFSAYIN